MMTKRTPTPMREIGIENDSHPPRILAVFAHPDDESFCAGGTLAKYAAEGAEIMVVSATRGEAGQIRDVRAATRYTLGQVRECELRLACTRLGIRHAVCLDYGDGTLKAVDSEALTGDIMRIVREFRPNVVITFGPDGAYGHPDHVAIGEATTTACTLARDAAAFPDQITEGLAPHTPEATFHCHFPRSRTLLLDHLARWLVSQERRVPGSHDFMHALLLLAQETSLLGYTGDHIDVQWYPVSFSIIEQGEPATRLYLILSGAAEMLREDDDIMQQMVTRLEPGMFFGEEGLVHGQASSAHVVALENVTCLVFAPGEPTAFAGRGTSANQDLDATAVAIEAAPGEATTAIDVSAYPERKVAAIASHRTQCPIAPDMLPLAMLKEIMGREYFVRVAPAREMESELLPRRRYAPVVSLHERWALPAAA